MNRLANLAAVVARVEALGLPGGPTVDRESGDVYEANTEASLPHVGVLYAKGVGGEIQEVGATTYETATGYEVHVSAASQDEALALLDALEAGLAGFCPDGENPLEWIDEELDVASHGYFLWVQAWKCRAVESR